MKDSFSQKLQSVTEEVTGSKKWTVFDDERQPMFEFKPLSNKTIRKVCAVWCNTIYSSDEEKLYYAELGEIFPDRIDDKTNEAFYEFNETYTSQHVLYAALATEMFRGFPELIEYDDEGVCVIKNEELSDALLRDKVHEAFVFFLQKFGAMPFGQANLLTNIQNGQLGEIMTKAMTVGAKAGSGTRRTPSDGGQE